MITQFRIENFKGHRDTTLLLQRFTLLVGDNGSGKTSVLEALQLLRHVDEHTERQALDEVLRSGAKQMTLSPDGVTGSERWAFSVALTPPGDPQWGNIWALRVSGVDNLGQFDESQMQGPWLANMPSLSRVKRRLGQVALYRFRSDQVASPAYSDRPGARVAEDGALTAVVLAAMKLADDEAFDRIEAAMRRIVPSLQRILIRPAELFHPSNPNPVIGSKLHFDFQGAKDVPAHHASQGTLVALALLTVLYGRDRPTVILLDDFDHALHPRAQIELVRMIKELLELEDFKDTQLVATTHSPYVLDEVSPSDVIAFAIRDDGTVAAKPLSEHPDAPRVNGSLKSGELWSLDAERDWVR